MQLGHRLELELPDSRLGRRLLDRSATRRRATPPPRGIVTAGALGRLLHDGHRDDTHHYHR
jgi:hypothetical protein